MVHFGVHSRASPLLPLCLYRSPAHNALSPAVPATPHTGSFGTMGASFLFGVFLDKYDVSPLTTTMVPCASLLCPRVARSHSDVEKAGMRVPCAAGPVPMLVHRVGPHTVPPSRPLAHRFGPRLTSIVGHVLLLAGFFLFANSYLDYFVPAYLIIGTRTPTLGQSRVIGGGSRPARVRVCACAYVCEYVYICLRACAGGAVRVCGAPRLPLPSFPPPAPSSLPCPHPCPHPTAVP